MSPEFGSTARVCVMLSPKLASIAPVFGLSSSSGPPPVVAHSSPWLVEGHVEDRLVERRERRAGGAAVMAELPERPAISAAARQDAAVGRFNHRQRADAGLALRNAGGESLRIER